MADERDESRVGPDPAAVTPGEAAAARERAFWETRRRYQELDDDEAGRREKRRLSKESRRMNLEVRMHRYARSHDEGPDRAVGPLLPPLPDDDLFPDDEPFPDADGLRLTALEGPFTVPRERVQLTCSPVHNSIPSYIRV
ncbi:hypothetical protein ACFU9Y_36260, partial [Streptomyces sp. NPDC057621]|uniref:hypothetical protein n=1 Tax=Streptomyces sp. NPDC057621 TaxID=3346186 RepID=UPI003690C391